MASAYFSWISGRLDYGYEGHYKDQACHIRILQMFCNWLQLQTSDDNEQRNKISFKSIINHLKTIWVQDSDNNKSETWPKQIQDFDPMTFGLEEKIEQSKPLIEQWCGISVQQMKWKCTNNSKSSTKNLQDFVNSVTGSAFDLIEIIQFKNQIDILSHKLEIMCSSLECFEKCITSSNELNEYRDFVYVFFSNAAYVLCMYWVKDEEANDDEEIETALFDMLQKIKPFAAHVTYCYYSVLKSNDLLQFDDRIYGVTCAHCMDQAPVSFVDFFFEHTILEDVFLILREGLIHLFTFLANALPVQEEDVIRTQIYDIFNEEEDSYLLVPISVMKEDFSSNKVLLSDCMIKIDVLTDQIIQFKCRPSDSWNRLEAEKMNNIYFASLHRELSMLEEEAKWSNPVRGEEVHPYVMGIGFIRLFFRCFETWDDDRDEETRVQLRSVVTSLQKIWGQENDMRLLSSRFYAIRKEDNIDDLEHVLDIELKEKFQMSKQEISVWLISLSHCSFYCRPSTSNEILKFLDYILTNMNDLVGSRPSKDVAFEKLLLLKNLLTLATNCVDSKHLEELNMLAQVSANNAACLIYMYWSNEDNDVIPVETNLMLSNMLQKIKPVTPEVARTYIGTLKAICLLPYDYILLEQTAMSFVDFFFEDLMTTPWKNDIQILRDEVLFLLTFVHHHHTGNVEEIICNQLDVLFNDDVYDLLPFDDMKKVGQGLSDLILNIRTSNAHIRHIYCTFTDSFLSNFPRIIGQGFLNSLIQKLRNLMERMTSDQKYVSCGKYKIEIFEQELLSLTPTFDKILELQDRDRNDAWLEVVNVVYLAEHCISLCHIFYHLIWHYIPYLFDIVDRMKIVRTKIEEFDMCDSSLMSTPLLQQDQTSEIHGVVVGFEEDEKIIVENITRGTESLDIVSIVGMGGLGKTTLAKKVYSSASVKSHFNVFAFTYVSQSHDKRRLLLDILKNIGVVDANTSSMTEDDLAHKLKKCLSRKKYFIVLDDIWDIKHWDEVRSSFPDNQNGSRIMFTTRSLEVAKRGKIKCDPHHLGFLSKDESWQLLQRKLFHHDMPPPNISSVAKLIAEKCHGLPLAIVVIAGLLARTETSLWIDISKRVSSCLFDEGCMNILELSYTHLPEYLKPCLLYLGGFAEDRSYKVRRVTLLWIAEGFIKESETKCLNEVAKDYLYELVSRSLLIADERTIGDIRTFRVHDLIHDLCQKKCRDENFFQIGHGTATSSFSAISTYKHYRVSMQKLSDINAYSAPSLANTCSLLCFPSEFDYSGRIFPLKKFRFAQVLYLEHTQLQQSDFADVISLVDLRHLEVEASLFQSIPTSIANLWNVQSLILTNWSGEEIDLPESLWRMKSLRNVKVHGCKLNVSDGYELNAYPDQLDKVVSFSRPCLSNGKDVEWLLQRLPAVRKLGCTLDYEFDDSIEERAASFDFHSKLESLKLGCKRNRPYIIDFPSTLVKLTLKEFHLPWTAISAIAELQCLRILKLRGVSLPGPTLETGEMTFPNLKYFELCGSRSLELWNADIDSFPCLEQIYFDNTALEELPPCFGEISSLKKITIWYSPKLKDSARRIREEQLDWGNNVELWMRD